MYLFFLAVFILAEIDRSLSFFYTSVPVSEVDMLPQQSSRACNALFHSRTCRMDGTGLHGQVHAQASIAIKSSISSPLLRRFSLTEDSS